MHQAGGSGAAEMFLTPAVGLQGYTHKNEAGGSDDAMHGWEGAGRDPRILRCGSLQPFRSLAFDVRH